MITDHEMIEASRNALQRLSQSHTEFSLISVETTDLNCMLLRFLLENDDQVYRLQLPLPSSSELKPWLRQRPTTAVESAADLSSFLLEEIDTGLKNWGKQLGAVAGEREFLLEAYGLRRRERAEHVRLTAAAGPDGWWGYIQE